MSTGFVRYHFVLRRFDDNCRHDFYWSLHRNTLAISLRRIVHQRKSSHYYNVYLAVHGDIFQHSLSWSSCRAWYSNKVLFLLSVSFPGLSSHDVFVNQYPYYRHTLVYQHLFAQANPETYNKDQITSRANGLGREQPEQVIIKTRQKLSTLCMMKTGLKNVLLPNIPSQCYTWLRLNKIVHYYKLLLSKQHVNSSLQSSIHFETKALRIGRFAIINLRVACCVYLVVIT